MTCGNCEKCGLKDVPLNEYHDAQLCNWCYCTVKLLTKPENELSDLEKLARKELESWK